MDGLRCWCRSVCFTDEDEDGIGEITVKFKIRDEEERMQRIFDSMSRNDAKEIAKEYIEKLAEPCEDYDEDFDDPDSGFGVDFGFEDGFIVVSASFRT